MKSTFLNYEDVLPILEEHSPGDVLRILLSRQTLTKRSLKDLQ